MTGPDDKPDLDDSPEARERGDSILRRMLKTPPTPHKPKIEKRGPKGKEPSGKA